MWPDAAAGRGEQRGHTRHNRPRPGCRRPAAGAGGGARCRGRARTDATHGGMGGARARARAGRRFLGAAPSGTPSAAAATRAAGATRRLRRFRRPTRGAGRATRGRRGGARTAFSVLRVSDFSAVCKSQKGQYKAISAAKRAAKTNRRAARPRAGGGAGQSRVLLRLGGRGGVCACRGLRCQGRRAGGGCAGRGRCVLVGAAAPRERARASAGRAPRPLASHNAAPKV